MIIIKICKKCGIEKELNEFRKVMQNKDGKDTICKECRKQEYKENPAQKRYYYKNTNKIKSYQAEYREEHREYYALYYRNLKEENPESEKRRLREYREKNKDLYNEYQKKRKAMEKALDNSYPEINIEILNDMFKDGCCLIGETDEVTLDHFIPISWGHGGTYIGNIYPLNITINRSKSGLNPFEWIKWAIYKYEIDIHKWNELIKKLAISNNLSIAEFKDFVYWCESNKRTVEEVQKENVPSIELWKMSLQLK